MTTREAEARYLSDHLRATAGAESNIYNPRNVPVDELPVIYGFNADASQFGCRGVIVAQDGTCLGGHYCSNEGYMRSDLGMIPNEYRSKTFREHYPDGFRTEFVSLNDVPHHEWLQLALRENAKNSEGGRND